MAITAKSIGDFQANVGQVGASIGVIMSYIFAGILIIFAIVMAVMAFIPMKPWDCDANLKALNDNVDVFCGTNNFPQECKQAKDELNNEKQRCSKKVEQKGLLWFLLLIPFAIIIVLISLWWNHFVKTNKTAAQIGGTMFELNTLKNFFRY